MIRPLVSLVVPVWGDDDFLVDLVNRAALNPATAEWIVAAVEPSPGLMGLADRGVVRLVVCERPSRGAQMNAGAQAARGFLLCFHHADSEFRPEHLESLALVTERDDIVGGAFHRRFDNRHFLMRMWECLLRGISTKVGPLFGDQSIFVRADVFRQMGGFAEIPIMEDIDFSRRLRRAGRIALLDPPLWSSPRRFRRLGNLSTSTLNGLFIMLFWFGVSPEALHRWYYRARFASRGERRVGD